MNRPKTSVVGIQISENNASDNHFLLPDGVFVGADDSGQVTPCSTTLLRWMLTCHTVTEDSPESGPVDEDGDEGKLRLPCSVRIPFLYYRIEPQRLL